MDVIPFTPSRFGKNPHYQTIFTNLLGQLPGYAPDRAGLTSKTVVIPTGDDTGDRLSLKVHRLFGADNERAPAIVLLHGLEGSADSIYMVEVTEKLLRAGFHVVRMNLRSCGEGLNLARHTYHGGLTIDVESVLQYVRDAISPYAGLVGYSLGSNLVLKYMGEDRAERNRQLAVLGTRPKRRRKIRDRLADVFVAVSPPLDLHASCEVLDMSTGRIYRNNFLREMRKRVDPQGKYDHIPNARAELPHISSWFEFDHLYIAPAAGFRGAIEYYMHCASRFYVKSIEAPGLVLHSRDDPLINPVGWDETNWENHPHITAHLTEHGGHIGWRSKQHPFIPDRRWMDYRILHYLQEWRDSLKHKRSIFSLFRRNR